MKILHVVKIYRRRPSRTALAYFLCYNKCRAAKMQQKRTWMSGVAIIRMFWFVNLNLAPHATTTLSAVPPKLAMTYYFVFPFFCDGSFFSSVFLFWNMRYLVLKFKLLLFRVPRGRLATPRQRRFSRTLVFTKWYRNLLSICEPLFHLIFKILYPIMKKFSAIGVEIVYTKNYYVWVLFFNLHCSKYYLLILCCISISQLAYVGC